MGAWIETLSRLLSMVILLGLLPIWEHGLKQQTSATDTTSPQVAPYMGAWIETPLVVKNIVPIDGCSLYGSMD